MIKLCLKVNEEESLSFGEIIANHVVITIEEYSKNATKAETKTINLLKKRLDSNESIQIHNECENETNKRLVNLLNKIITK